MTTQPEDTPEIDDAPDYDVLEFTTSPTRNRDTDHTPVTLCGEEVTARRPKDFVLFTAQSALSEVATDSDKAMSMLQVLNASFGDVDRHRILERCCDSNDPLTAGATYQMIDELTDRWSHETKIPVHRPVIISPHPDTAPAADPVRIRINDLGLDALCSPPKDIVLHIVASGIATGVSQGHQIWCVMLFLDAALTSADASILKHRLRNSRDSIDLADLMEIIHGLMRHWYPDTDLDLSAKGNRKQRRAGASQKRKKKGKAAVTSGQSELFPDE